MGRKHKPKRALAFCGVGCWRALAGSRTSVDGVDTEVGGETTTTVDEGDPLLLFRNA